MDAYRSIFYTLYDFLLLYTFSIDLDPIIKDLITVYIALGGITARTTAALFQIHWLSRKFHFSRCRLGFLNYIGDVHKFFVYLIAFTIWPYIVIRLLMNGMVLYKLPDYKDDPDPRKPTYSLQISKVFFLQFLGLIAFIVFFICTNIIFI